MRRLLLVIVTALLLGASSIWLMQQDSGYILFSLNNTTVEMTAWVGLLLFLLVTGIAVWLILLVRWLSDGGGLRQWWGSRRSERHANKTAQGLILFADHDWQKASEILAASAPKSSMPDVNLLFSARAAAENNQIDLAHELLEKLKESKPKASLLVDKTFAEILLREERFAEALALLQPIAQAKPEDRGVLRLLSDIYYLTNDWVALQKLLSDINRFKALNKVDFEELEIDVYANLLGDFTLNTEVTAQEQRDQVGDLWELIPKHLRHNAVLISKYFDALKLVNDADKLAVLAIKSINSRWNSDLVREFGEAETSTPEKHLMTAEKWLINHPEDPALLMTLGNLCCQLKFWGKARDYFSSAVKLNPTPTLLLKLANVLTEMGEHKESQNLYRQGLLLSIKTQDN